MFDFIQKLIYSVLALQEKILGKKHGKNFKSVYSNTTSKKVFAQAASLEVTSKTEKNKLKLENNLKLILKKYENNPQKLLEFIQRSGTEVYKIPFAHKILAFIKYEEGLIGKTEGLKALYLNAVILLLAGKKSKFSKINFFKTEPMFILREFGLDGYRIIQQFHKWYAMKLNLPGFDTESQNNFQKFINSNDENVKLSNIEEILGLKEAIARDVEAINFIVNLAKSTAGSKNALKKMTTGGASV